MSITESDQKVIREIFMEAASDLLVKERELLEGMLRPIEVRLANLESRLGRVEVAVSSLVRFEEMERRIQALEEAARH